MSILSNFILTLRLKTQPFQEEILDKRFEIGRNIYNGCLGELYKRYNTLRQSKEYQKVVKKPKGKDRSKKFKEIDKEYGLTEYSLHNYVKTMQKHFKSNIDSFTAQKIATRCFHAFQKLMFHQSKKVYYKKHGEMNSLEGKTNKTGIRYKDKKMYWNKLEISVNIKKNDEYAEKALDNRIKYCRIIRKFIRGKNKYYIQLVLEGIPPKKINKETGETKNSIGKGNVGLDIGTQTIAISSKHCVKLLEIAPEVRNIEKEKRKLLRKLDRQRRINNPDNYNKDGTIRGDIKLKWIKSKKYIQTQKKLKEIQRKQAEIRKQSHYKLANYILKQGNNIKVETMNYKELQKRRKDTTQNEKTGRKNKKQRFGKSLANKAPSMLLTIIENKLKWHGEQLKKIDTTKVKASQYNHLKDEYTKKKLSERWNKIKDFKIQRDLYSAFLIMNVKSNLKEIDREQCYKTFDKFKKLHDKEIDRIKTNESKLISSMGI